MRALLFDATRCIGCGACAAACREENHLPATDSPELGPNQFTILRKLDDRGTEVNYRRLCMHCQDPTCASVCPVKALYKTPTGAVVYDPDICMGCRYCVQVCPFDVPRFEWTSLTPRVRKCGFCAARLAAGKPNACAEACPTGATMAGEREALLREARARLSAEPDKYVQKIYGEQDAGGTSVLVLSPVRFSRLGLPEGLPGEPLPRLTYRALSQVPAVAGGAGMLLAGLWWLTRRKAAVKQVESLDVAVKGGR